MKRILRNFIDFICFREYFRKKIDTILFWMGGALTILWSKMIIFEALGRNIEGREMTMPMTTLYIFSLAFFLGIKGVRKRLMNGNGSGNLSGKAPADKQAVQRRNYIDQYAGEIWATILIIAGILIIHDYLSGGFHFFGPVAKIPKQMYYSIFGVIGLFSATKLFDIWTLIKKHFPFFKDLA